MTVSAHTENVLLEVIAERRRQDARWGEQNHPDGTGRECDKVSARDAREACDRAFREGWGTWSHILREEFREALAEGDQRLLRVELLQVAAVAVAWVESIDRRQGMDTGAPTREPLDDNSDQDGRGWN